jgi:hypothetical protein
VPITTANALGFKGCGKTQRKRQEVSGHDFSRADKINQQRWALAPAKVQTCISFLACLFPQAPKRHFSKRLDFNMIATLCPHRFEPRNAVHTLFSPRGMIFGHGRLDRKTTRTAKLPNESKTS